MVKEVVGDLLADFKAGKVNVILHQANCFHTMKSGIAGAIVRQYPEAEKADNKTLLGDKNKLGTYSVATIDKIGRIVNIYSQFDIVGSPHTQDDIKDVIDEGLEKVGRATRYDAIAVAMTDIRNMIEKSKAEAKFKIGVPYGYGSALGGGSWSVVRAIIESVFAKSKVEVIIVRLPSQPELT